MEKNTEQKAALDFITPLIQLATEVMKRVNADAAKKWSDARTANLLQIQEEEAKGDLANDRLIEELYAKQPIIDQAAKDELDRSSNQ